MDSSSCHMYSLFHKLLILHAECTNSLQWIRCLFRSFLHVLKYKPISLTLCYEGLPYPPA